MTGWLGVRRVGGVATADVGGAAHNSRMNNMDTCERCDGSGADPRQSLVADGFEDVVELCIECRGDGVVVSFAEYEIEHRQAA